MRVIRAVVDAQREFFDKGPEFLKPLPMIQVADQLGIHVATVSRAVSEKWIQTPRGVFPLRRFFSGGTTSAEGEDMSWDAVKEKLKTIIAKEDKNNPLNDDEIVEKLKAQGIELARRTVAKYRKILNIPTAQAAERVLTLISRRSSQWYSFPMTKRQFYDWQSAGGGGDVLLLVETLEEAEIAWCMIGGIAVNHWAEEPVVTADVDIVIAADDVQRAVRALEEAGFRIERFEWSINLKGRFRRERTNQH